ncbi:hypothetical protein COCOR_06816 [Corallococcus coralloides DSM 2259]|uniref:DUF3618 domain-containing protein n=1 Tax=Corallococcus coralloides (strain ATCC 25202 / DSM 2259 / NBRC 100086 / M2) TaxID=1144275 RepID=H8N0W1_CORCM|nr:hypothetical protein [Corallococcus coralloides]AFE07144.1 hypothetical protein COCOR_06816 [Corallococcus coralloides DSM 2259]
MGEHDDALREIADARARMSVLADELGRRANPELLKARAKEFALEKKEEVTEHAKQLAAEKREELKQQAREKVLDWKSHAKETAMRKTYEWTDEATHTPRGLGLLGALLGAGVGSMLMKRAFRSRIEEREYRVREYERVPVGPGRERIPLYEAEREYYGAYGSGRVIPVEGYNTREESSRDEGMHLKDRASEALHMAKETVGSTTENVKDRVSSAADTVRGRVHDAADTVRSQASHLRERVPSPQAIRGRTSQWYDRALEEQPLALALGAVALGMMAASLLPVTDKERQLLEPAKRRAQEGLAQLGDQVSQKLEGSEEDTSSAETISMGASGGIPPLPPLEQIAPKVH